MYSLGHFYHVFNFKTRGQMKTLHLLIHLCNIHAIFQNLHYIKITWHTIMRYSDQQQCATVTEVYEGPIKQNVFSVLIWALRVYAQ